jgi:hypothetical protein
MGDDLPTDDQSVSLRRWTGIQGGEASWGAQRAIEGPCPGFEFALAQVGDGTLEVDADTFQWPSDYLTPVDLPDMSEVDEAVSHYDIAAPHMSLRLLWCGNTAGDTHDQHAPHTMKGA